MRKEQQSLEVAGWRGLALASFFTISANLGGVTDS